LKTQENHVTNGIDSFATLVSVLGVRAVLAHAFIREEGGDERIKARKFSLETFTRASSSWRKTSRASSF